MMRANRKWALTLLASGMLVGMSLWAQSSRPAAAPSQNGQPVPASGTSASTGSTSVQVDPVAASPSSFAPFGVATFPSGQGYSYGGGGMAYSTNRDSAMAKAANKINQVKSALKKANTDDEKKKADEQLTVALNEYFEADMAQRKKEFADVKKRVEDLEKQLLKRETSKGEIVDLQKKVIVSEVNGLGFYGASPNSVFGTSGSTFFYPPMTPSAPVPPASVVPATR